MIHAASYGVKPSTSKIKLKLTPQQENIVTSVGSGRNVLVDACIGSGKTSVLEEIYRRNTSKSIIYLTFNKLLKLEAQSRLPKRRGSIVQNYHGFVYPYLRTADMVSGIGESLASFKKAYEIGKVRMPKWDLLLIDEYQDINEQMAGVLECVKHANPGIQIIAVGDMAQKIYDNTRLDVYEWVGKFLNDFTVLGLTTCFRLSKDHAAMLGRVWEKEITGVNRDCDVRFLNYDTAVEIAGQCNPDELLVLGAKSGMRNHFQNTIEGKYPEKYNKQTLYAAIDDDAGRETTQLLSTDEAAVFTTFDASKGMERSICMVFDFDFSYWNLRAVQAGVKYNILRNIFCVAASRGKKAVYFVGDANKIMTERALKRRFNTAGVRENVPMSRMFHFKYKEHIDDCYATLGVERIPTTDVTPIDVTTKDGFIDLTPCIGIYQEASYFLNYNINASWDGATRNAIKQALESSRVQDNAAKMLKQHVLYMAAVETGQMRYAQQVEVDFMENEAEEYLRARIGERLPRDSVVQVECELPFKSFTANGRCDAVHEGVPYELKFVGELSHEHFLQIASYIVALDKPYGILWNTRDNTMYKVTVPDIDGFKRAAERAITGQ